MLFLKYLLLFTGWGLLVAAAVNVFKNLYQIVQYHRQLRPIAPAFCPALHRGRKAPLRERHRLMAFSWKNRN